MISMEKQIIVQRVYIDTSVIGGCEDEEFLIWSRKLFDDFRSHRRIAIVSDLTLEKLTDAPENVKRWMQTIPESYIEKVFVNSE